MGDPSSPGKLATAAATVTAATIAAVVLVLEMVQVVLVVNCVVGWVVKEQVTFRTG